MHFHFASSFDARLEAMIKSHLWASRSVDVPCCVVEDCLNRDHGEPEVIDADIIILSMNCLLKC